VFSLDIGGAHIPLILIAIMTMVLITSSGTMAMAVNFGYRRHRANTTALMLITAAFGATFVGMQAFEWTKLIREGVRPWGNPLGATQFGSYLFMDLGTAVHLQHFLLPDRLLSSAWLSQVVSDHHLHVAEGRLHRRRLHAHGVGAPGAEICDSRPAAVPADSDWAYGGGRGLH